MREVRVAKGGILQERGEGEGIKERETSNCVVCVYVYWTSPFIQITILSPYTKIH
jgi:hypothetical protein